MAKDFAIFKDYFRIVKPTDKQITEWKDSLLAPPMNSPSSSSSQNEQIRKGLEMTFEATHSGFFNDNRRFYLPARMEAGAPTFVNRNKPAKILKHHDSESDPVGIILSSEYVPTVPDYLEHNRDVQIMMDNSNSITKQLQAARRFLKSGIPFADDWRGLGFIKLKGVVLDEITIQQVRDQLFDAVSTSFRSPGEAYCSVCLQNWADEGMCEHMPGQHYSEDDDEEEIPCGIIPGTHSYDELSFVVFDGDPLTSVSIGHQDSLKEISIPVKDWQNTSGENTSGFVFSFRDYKEEINMADQATGTVLSDIEKEVFAAVKKLRPKLDDEKATVFTQQLVALKGENGKYPDQEEAELDDETSFLYALEDLETADQEINADAIADEMKVELKAMLDESLVTKEDYEVADATLSSAQRKKLSASTFCGPDRSFPVPDCAHVTAARRLIGRYKGPGNKTKILACVNRKSKALGCDGSKKDDLQPPEIQADKFEIPTCDMIGTLDDAKIHELFNMAEAEMITRNLKLDRPCGKCATHEDETKKAKEALEDSQSIVTKLEGSLSVLREELRHQMSDYMEQVDRFVELGTELSTAKRDHLALVGTLQGRFESVEKATDALNESNLDEQHTVIMDGFNLKDIMTKLNDGMSRDPEGTVDSPIPNKDINNNQLPEGLSSTAIAAIANIRDFVKHEQMAEARTLYGKMVVRKVFDEKLVPFESLSANNPVSAG